MKIQDIKGISKAVLVEMSISETEQVIKELDITLKAVKRRGENKVPIVLMEPTC